MALEMKELGDSLAPPGVQRLKLAEGLTGWELSARILLAFFLGLSMKS